MDREELQLRQLSGQRLLAPDDKDAVLRALCGLQAQFLSHALHALRLRSRDFAPGTDADGIIKSWTLRGTMHIFSESDLPLFLYRGRSHFLRPCDTLAGDEHISAERKQVFAELIVRAVADGIDEREALKQLCFDAGLTETEAQSVFDPWGGTLRALCESDVLCHKVQEKKAFRLCPPFEPMEEAEARLEIARRYFTNYGPATLRDAAYFLGATQAQIKAWLREIPVEAALCEGRTYYHIGNALPDGELPVCRFLAGFDPLMLGYEKKESLYLPAEHLRGIFTLAGIVQPALLLRGRVVGRWKRKGKRLAVALFEPVSAADRLLIEEEAFRLWAGEALCVFET